MMDVELDHEDRVILRPRKLRLILLLFLSSIFVAGGVLMLGEPDRFDHWVGVCNIAFFGLGVVIFGMSLLPGSSYLELDEERMVAHSLFRSYSYRWDEITGLGIFEGFGIRLVTLNLSEDASQKRMRSFNRRFFGYEAQLPDTYGMTAEDLADMLANWQQKCLSCKPTEDYDDLDGPVD